MGKSDIATKSYMSANTRFADIFNFCLYEMLDVKDDNLWHYISDYRVNLILLQEIEDERAV